MNQGNFRLIRKNIREAKDDAEREMVLRTYRRMRQVGLMDTLLEIAIIAAMKELPAA